MVKPLSFKGDPKTKKRKRPAADEPHRTTDPFAEKSSSSSTSKRAAAAAAAAAAADEEEASHGREEDDDTWVSADAVSDVSGPILLVLSTSPVTALASDAHGKVFASEIENMIEGDARTAEPHDVRQVWVANRVAGTEGFTLKGHHGKYLSADKIGLLSSTATAISPNESFVCIPVPETRGVFSFQTARDTFLSASSREDGTSTIQLRADADSISYPTHVRVRMQARFKPKHKEKKAEKAREKISRKELEDMVGRRLEEDEVRMLKRARKEGDFHEKLLDVKVKGKHDKFA